MAEIDTECLDPDAFACAAFDLADAGRLAGRATEKENSSRRAPRAPEAVPAAAERRLAETETRSPGVNGRVGEKAVPWSPGCALNRPVWRPLREPTTVT